MSPTTAAFALAIVVILGIIGLLWRVTTLKGKGGTAKFTVAKLFTAEIVVGEDGTAGANEAVRMAAANRGNAPSESAITTIATAKVARLTRLLWVDDNPDNNILETIALERLGFFVTKTTSTEGAREYIKRLDYSIAITDLTRGQNREAGIELLRYAKSATGILVIVYTGSAAAQKDQLVSEGAFSVVDRPDDLVAAVIRARSSL